MALFAADLRSTGEFRDDLTDEEVADVVWSTNAAEYWMLLHQRGWTPARYEAWLVDLWSRTLLGLAYVGAHPVKRPADDHLAGGNGRLGPITR